MNKTLSWMGYSTRRPQSRPEIAPYPNLTLFSSLFLYDRSAFWCGLLLLQPIHLQIWSIVQFTMVKKKFIWVTKQGVLAFCSQQSPVSTEWCETKTNKKKVCVWKITSARDQAVSTILKSTHLTPATMRCLTSEIEFFSNLIFDVNNDWSSWPIQAWFFFIWFLIVLLPFDWLIMLSCGRAHRQLQTPQMCLQHSTLFGVCLYVWSRRRQYFLVHSAFS